MPTTWEDLYEFFRSYDRNQSDTPDTSDEPTQMQLICNNPLHGHETNKERRQCRSI